MESEEFSPARLTLARRRRGFTKRALGEEIGRTERAIVRYERSDRAPEPETMQLLSKKLRFPVSFFFRKAQDTLSEADASFRALSKLKAADRERALAGGELVLDLADWIDAQFVLPKPDLPNLRPQPTPEEAADALRIRWGLDDKPIANMIRLLEAKGVRVFSLAEDCAEVDAFSFWRGDQPFVMLNTMKSAERSRFDAAHELGHLVLHRHGQPNGREAEREADVFASAFLMPRTSILAYAPRNPTIANILRAKRQWNVAAMALVHRMHSVGVISDWYYRQLCIQMSGMGYRKVEPEGGDREMSQVLEKVFAALRARGKSRNDVARELDWPLDELRAFVFQLVIGSVAGGSTEPPPKTTPQTAGPRILRIVG